MRILHGQYLVAALAGMLAGGMYALGSIHWAFIVRCHVVACGAAGTALTYQLLVDPVRALALVIPSFLLTEAAWAGWYWWRTWILWYVTLSI
jgi:hypothetical protein